MKRVLSVLFAAVLAAACTPQSSDISEDAETSEERTPEELLQAYPSEYRELMERKDLVIEDRGGVLVNGELWDGFLDAVDAHVSSEVTIARFTIEGDPVLYRIEYDGEGFRWYYDSSRDRFGAGESFLTGTAKYLLKFREGDRLIYVLCSEELANLHVVQHTEIDGEPIDPPLQILAVKPEE